MLRRPWVSGAALVIRTEAWRAVGGFDTRYFMYFEDEDLCRRLRALGWEVGLDPSVTVAHRVGTTSHSNPYRSVVYQRSRVLYHSRYSPRWLQAFVRWSANRITDGQRRREMSARH
jgi:N-acetylglucosaminyl-diphospho-decaprenol L-rhamnosyltransferase